MNKRALYLLSALALTLSAVLSGCGGTAKPGNDKVINIGATPTPHAEILNAIKADLLAKGYTLNITEFTDYVQPNVAVYDNTLDANFFQHVPYMESFNTEKKADLVSAGTVHYEPLGLYPGKTKAIADLQDGASVAVPNDTTNEARALLLLETAGLIKVKEGSGMTATKLDIVENPKNLDIKELAAEQLPRTLSDVDMAVINGNYALQANLNAATDALIKEESNSLAAETFANVVAVRKGNETSPKIVALMDALHSDAVKKFIEEKYQGAVVAKNK